MYCSTADRPHVGTTDVDVQVNLEIQGGSANAAQLEHGLKDAGFKAAHGRALDKDWYDIAYVLLNNDADGPSAAGRLVRERFSAAVADRSATAMTELSANFHDETAQGSSAYADTMLKLYPELDGDILANDAVAAIAAFSSELNTGRDQVSRVAVELNTSTPQHRQPSPDC